MMWRALPAETQWSNVTEAPCSRTHSSHHETGMEHRYFNTRNNSGRVSLEKNEYVLTKFMYEARKNSRRKAHERVGSFSKRLLKTLDGSITYQYNSTCLLKCPCSEPFSCLHTFSAFNRVRFIPCAALMLSTKNFPCLIQP